MVDVATELDIIHKSGAWFSYEGNKIGQGRENTKEFLLNNPEMLSEIEEKIFANKDALSISAKASKKEAELSAAASAAAAGQSSAKKPSNSVIVDADDDFEEFTPATDN